MCICCYYDLVIRCCSVRPPVNLRASCNDWVYFERFALTSAFVGLYACFVIHAVVITESVDFVARDSKECVSL